jgi:hypothetical protein
MNTQQLEVTDKKMLRLQREKKVAREHQERKHDDWNDNYELYRNKVRTNRLTQRQAVNIPLMKETIKTVLSAIDEVPNVKWQETSGDELKELIYQEMWDANFRDNKLDWIDLVDKKNVLLYGLSSKMINTGDNGPEISVLDTWDIVYDPTMNPLDIESARFIIRQNIYRSLREILADDRYSEKGKNELRNWADTEDAVIQSNSNMEEAEKRNKRLEAMGVSHSDFATFGAGDVIVNLTEHFTRIWNKDEQKFEKHVVTYADDWMELSDEKLEDLLGIDEWPFVVWYEDPETNDVYPDGIADLVRTPNKILNVWFSQQVENRTLQNFQMHWYDSTKKGFTPQTYEPGPGRMLPAPGNPRETIMPVEINGLDETFTAIDYLTRMVERGSGAVAISKGTGEERNQTLGEIEILVGKAQERSVAMQKFYRGSWYELAVKWNKIMHANPPGELRLFRTGRSGKLYEKKVTQKDWEGEYEPLVSSSSEVEADQFKEIQKFQFVLQQFPDNMALRTVAQRRELEILDLTPGELKEIEDEEKKLQEMREQMAQQGMQQGAQPAQQGQQPSQQGVQSQQGDPEMDQLMQELATL